MSAPGVSWARVARAARRRSRDRRGVSLVELVATIAVLGMVLAIVYGGMSSTEATLRGTDERLRNLDEARVLMAATSRDVLTAVRLSAGASPFVVADGNEAVFYANLDPTAGPKQVRLSIDGADQLVEEVWEPDAGTVAPDYTYTGTPRVRFVGRYVDNDAAHPIFTYLDSAGAELGPLPLDADGLLAVRAVRIVLVVKKQSASHLHATTLVNRVRLPNLDYNAVAE